MICWPTDQKSGELTVEYTVPGRPPAAAKPERVALDFDKKVDPKRPGPDPKADNKDKDDPREATGDLPSEREQHDFKYVAGPRAERPSGRVSYERPGGRHRRASTPCDGGSGRPSSGWPVPLS